MAIVSDHPDHHIIIHMLPCILFSNSTPRYTSMASWYHGGTRKSLTSSYTKNDVAMLGATFTGGSININVNVWTRHDRILYLHRLGHRPRYRPLTPSVRMTPCKASSAPVYRTPNAPVFIPDTCIFLRRTSNGYVSVWDIEPWLHVSHTLNDHKHETHQRARRKSISSSHCFFPAAL